MKEKVSIEEMERKRFYVLLVETSVSLLFSIFLIWRLWMIDLDISVSRLVDCCFIGSVLLVWAVRSWGFSVLRKIRREKRLEQALDSELYTLYNYKAAMVGFCAVGIAGAIVMCMGFVFNLSAVSAVYMVLAAGWFAFDIRRLILYRP